MKPPSTSKTSDADFFLFSPNPQILAELLPMRVAPKAETYDGHAGTSMGEAPLYSPFTTPYKSAEEMTRHYETPSRSVGDEYRQQVSYDEVQRQPEELELERTNDQETSWSHANTSKSLEQLRREKTEEALHLPAVLLEEKNSLSTVLKVTPEGREILLALEEGKGMAFKPRIRQSLVHFMADHLQQFCLEKLDILHGTLYARHLLRPFPHVDLSLFVGKATSPLPRRLALKRKKLHAQGLHKLRAYKKKKNLEETSSEDTEMNDEELLRLASKINDVTVGTSVYFGLLAKTREFRLRFVSLKSPAETFRLLPFMAYDAQILVGDFCAKYFAGGKTEWWKEFDSLWTDLLISRAAASIPKTRQAELSSFLGESRQVRALVASLELLSQSTCKKKAMGTEARFELLYQHHPTVTDPMEIVRTLNGSHPIIFRIGSSSCNYIAYSGIPIQLTYSIGHALFVLLCIYDIFPVQFPTQISAALSLIERMVGVPSLKRCTTADSLFSVLMNDRTNNDDAL